MALRSPGSPNPEKNGIGEERIEASPDRLRNHIDVEMVNRRLSTLRSATFGDRAIGHTAASRGPASRPERKAAPVPTRPLNYRAAAGYYARQSSFSSGGDRMCGHLWGTGVTNLRQCNGLPLFRFREPPISKSGGGTRIADGTTRRPGPRSLKPCRSHRTGRGGASQAWPAPPSSRLSPLPPSISPLFDHWRPFVTQQHDLAWNRLRCLLGRGVFVSAMNPCKYSYLYNYK